MANSNSRFRNETRAADRLPLARQCAGRELNPEERAFAEALSDAFKAGAEGFDAAAAALAAAKVRAPVSGRTDWNLDLLRTELVALNADLDAAYRANGYGA